MSPSTTTPASPSRNCCPIRRSRPPSASCETPSPSTPATTSPYALCLPITAAAIVPTASDKPVNNSTFAITVPVPTRHAPTARRNVSSRPHCANGSTPSTRTTPSNAMPNCRLGSTTTTSHNRMVASLRSRPSAVPPTWEQRLDLLQPPTLVGGRWHALCFAFHHSDPSAFGVGDFGLEGKSVRTGLDDGIASFNNDAVQLLF